MAQYSDILGLCREGALPTAVYVLAAASRVLPKTLLLSTRLSNHLPVVPSIY